MAHTPNAARTLRFWRRFRSCHCRHQPHRHSLQVVAAPRSTDIDIDQCGRSRLPQRLPIVRLPAPPSAEIRNPHSASRAARGFLHERLSYACGTRNPSPIRSFDQSQRNPESCRLFSSPSTAASRTGRSGFQRCVCSHALQMVAVVGEMTIHLGRSGVGPPETIELF